MLLKKGLLTTTALAGMVMLSACGGGGGGGGGSTPPNTQLPTPDPTPTPTPNPTPTPTPDPANVFTTTNRNGATSVTYTNASGYATTVHDVFVHDINGDGVDEMVVAGRLSSYNNGTERYKVHVYTVENGVLVDKTSTYFNGSDNEILGTEPAVQFGDFNGDGSVDLFVGTGTDTDTYRGNSVLYTLTNGSFTKATVDTGDAWIHGNTAGDFDNDGFTDVVNTDYYANGGVHYINLVKGGAGGVTVYKDTNRDLYGASDVAAADFDGDGVTEFIFSDASGQSSSDTKWYSYSTTGSELDLTYVKSLPAPRFELPKWSSYNFGADSGSYASHDIRILAKDFDADSATDVLVFSRPWFTNGEWPKYSEVQFLQNDGLGNFTDVTDTTLVNYNTSTHVSYNPEFIDIDGDGDEDMFLSAGDFDGDATSNRFLIRTADQKYHDAYASSFQTLFDQLVAAEQAKGNTVADNVVSPFNIVTDGTNYYIVTNIQIEDSSGNTKFVAYSAQIDRSQFANFERSDLGVASSTLGSASGSFENNEYQMNANSFLDDINASVAYSRGWTGKGSLVLVADSGIDTDNPDLVNKIKYTKDFVPNWYGEDIEDYNGHGTHVAGIVAGERNGTGMHGVAFDADLAIAKISGSNGWSETALKQSAAWGRDLGAVAMNVSGNYSLYNTYTNTLVEDAAGDWHSTHSSYGTNGYYNIKSQANDWKTAIGDEMVLVVAAGNDGKDYTVGLSQLATVTDNNGDLIMDGQVIVAGAWDQSLNKIASFSNAAGNVCVTYTNGACQDAAKIKDYYLLAPGDDTTSTNRGGGTTTMSGTSMAAPVISGAVAIVHQMWPFMKGKNIVRLLLNTADKSIAGYDENIHGQGLLDLDEATKPQGATGIPTTGRTNGGVASLSGSASGANLQSASIFKDVMVLDSYERNFTVDLSQSYNVVDTRTIDPAKNLLTGNNFDFYYGFAKANNINAFGMDDFGLLVSTNESGGISALKAGYQFNDYLKISIGHVKEQDTFLGYDMSGVYGDVTGADTTYAAVDFGYNFNNNWSMFANYQHGFTQVNANTINTMLVKTDTLETNSWAVGARYKSGKHTIAASVSAPTAVLDGSFKYRIPTERTLDGQVNYADRNLDLSNSEREVDVSAAYTYNFNQDVSFTAYAEHRENYKHVASKQAQEIGAQIKIRF